MSVPRYLYHRYGVPAGGDANGLLQAMRSAHSEADEAMAELLEQSSNRDLTASEQRKFAEHERQLRDAARDIDELQYALGVGDYSPRGTDDSGGARFYDTASGREMRGYSHDERLSAGRPDGPSFGAFVAGAIRSSMGQRMSEREQRALEAATGSAGGYLVSEELSSRFIDALRARSVVSRAGAVTLPLDGAADKYSIARIDSDPTPYWRAENEVVPEGDPSFSAVQLTPKTVGILTKIPVELIQDTANLEAVVERSLTESVGSEIDRVALFGSGTGQEPQGVCSWPGVSATALDGELTSYVPLVQALRALMDDDVDIDAPTVAAVMSPREWETLELLTDTTDQPLTPPRSVQNLRKFTSTKVPTNAGAGGNESQIVTGDFGRILLGVRQSIQVEILRELFRERLQIGILVWARFDVAIEREQSLSLVTGIQPGS